MTTYSNISYATTTLIDTFHGRGIMCDNEDIYCNSQEYYCDGSIVFRSISFDAGDIQALFGGQKVKMTGLIGFWQLGSGTTYTKISYP